MRTSPLLLPPACISPELFLLAPEPAACQPDLVKPERRGCKKWLTTVQGFPYPKMTTRPCGWCAGSCASAITGVGLLCMTPAFPKVSIAKRPGWEGHWILKAFSSKNSLQFLTSGALRAGTGQGSQ